MSDQISDWDDFLLKAQRLWGETRGYFELGSFVERMLVSETQPALAELQTRVEGWDSETFKDFQSVVQTMIVQSQDYIATQEQTGADAIKKARQRISALQGILIYADRFRQPLPPLKDFKSYLEEIIVNPMGGFADLRRRAATWDGKTYARFTRILSKQIETSARNADRMVVLEQVRTIAATAHQNAIPATPHDNRSELLRLRDEIEAGTREGRISGDRYTTIKTIMDQLTGALNAPDADPEATVAALTRLRAMVDTLEPPAETDSDEAPTN
jgi:hypothetical protein